MKTEYLHQTEVDKNFPLSSHAVPWSTWGQPMDSSVHQQAYKGKVQYLMVVLISMANWLDQAVLKRSVNLPCNKNKSRA